MKYLDSSKPKSTKRRMNKECQCYRAKIIYFKDDKNRLQQQAQDWERER
jgi:hypothetical protein